MCDVHGYVGRIVRIKDGIVGGIEQRRDSECTIDCSGRHVTTSTATHDKECRTIALTPDWLSLYSEPRLLMF